MAQPTTIEVTPISTADGVYTLLVPPRDTEILSVLHSMVVSRAEKRSLVTEDDENTNQIKKKRPLYMVRKEEKARLEQELHELQARVDELKEMTGITGLVAVSAQLQDAANRQQLIIAQTQSVLSEFTNNQQRSPVESFIHLTKDWRQRQAMLLALRGPKLDVARRFLAARTRGLSLTKVCSETSKFQQEDHSFCTIKLTITPFRGLQSPKQVYDALMFYIYNLEISISELTGSTTVSENLRESSIDVSGSALTPGVLCHRLVTDLQNGLEVEKNAIQFFTFQDPETTTRKEECGMAGEEFALMTADYANVDELYPYQPQTRLRKDINTVLRISSHYEQSSNEEKDDLVVVLTYWVYIKTHTPQLQDRTLTTMEHERVHDELVHAMDILPISMKQNLYGGSGGQ